MTFGLPGPPLSFVVPNLALLAPGDEHFHLRGHLSVEAAGAGLEELEHALDARPRIPDATVAVEPCDRRRAEPADTVQEGFLLVPLRFRSDLEIGLLPWRGRDRLGGVVIRRPRAVDSVLDLLEFRLGGRRGSDRHPRSGETAELFEGDSGAPALLAAALRRAVALLLLPEGVGEVRDGSTVGGLGEALTLLGGLAVQTSDLGATRFGLGLGVLGCLVVETPAHLVKHVDVADGLDPVEDAPAGIPPLRPHGLENFHVHDLHVRDEPSALGAERGLFGLGSGHHAGLILTDELGFAGGGFRGLALGLERRQPHLLGLECRRVDDGLCRLAHGCGRVTRRERLAGLLDGRGGRGDEASHVAAEGGGAAGNEIGVVGIAGPRLGVALGTIDLIRDCVLEVGGAAGEVGGGSSGHLGTPGRWNVTVALMQRKFPPRGPGKRRVLQVFAETIVNQ